jgi:hypothetical protein
MFKKMQDEIRELEKQNIGAVGGGGVGLTTLPIFWEGRGKKKFETN